MSALSLVSAPIELPHGINPLLALREYAQGLDPVYFHLLELEAQYGWSRRNTEKVLRHMSEPLRVKTESGLVVSDGVWKTAPTLSFYIDTPGWIFHEGGFSLRIRTGNEYFPAQFGMKARNVHSDLQERIFRSYGSSLAARFEYEQIIPDLRTFDPNDISFYENELIRGVMGYILSIPGGGPLGLKFATDVERSSADFIFKNKGKTLCFEPVMDMCSYYGFPDPSDKIWQRLPDVTSGRRATAEDLQKMSGGSPIGFVPQLETEYKKKQSRKSQITLADIPNAESQIRACFERAISDALIPKATNKAEDGVIFLMKAMPWLQTPGLMSLAIA